MANTHIALEGGLDLETPPIDAKPGQALEALNFYESVKGGYTTLKGYEKYSGQPKPSLASYYHVAVTDMEDAAGAVSLTVGAALVLGTLTLTIAAVYTQAGPPDQMVIIGVEPVGIAPTLPLAFDTGASVDALTAVGDAYYSWETSSGDDYLTIAQDLRRAAILAVPGDGAVCGVAQFEDTVLAWRGTAGALQCYKDTASGWFTVPYAEVWTVDVTAATVASVGDVCNTAQHIIVGVYDYLTAGVPDTNKRVYVIDHVYGAAPTAFTNIVGAVNHGTVIGQVAWAPASAGSNVQYEVHNFAGGTATNNLYFADNVNVPMVYLGDLDIIAPISSDYRTLSEVASFVVAHNSRLFIATGSTFITTIAGDATTIDGTLLSVEVGLGDVITGFTATASDKLAIFTRNHTYVLSGNSAADWILQPASKNSGARHGCTAQTDDVFSSDDRGITRLSRTDTLGGFAAATITDDIQSLFTAIHANATCATTIRELNQMRFYYGNRAIIASRVPYNANGNEGIRYGVTEALFNVPVLNVSTEENLSGVEQTFFGSDDGFVYQSDVGSSADGSEMEFILTLHFNHMGSPLIRKRFIGVDIEAKVIAPTTFQVFYYMDDGQKTFDPRTVAFVGGAADFDVALFDSAVFDAVPLTRPRMTLRGTGYNLQLSFYRQSAHEPQSTLTGYAMRFKERSLVAL